MLKAVSVKARPVEDDPIRRIGPGGRAVRDADIWRSREVIACPRDPVLNASGNRTVELQRVARVVDCLDQLRARPRLAAIEGLDHEVAAVGGRNTSGFWNCS